MKNKTFSLALVIAAVSCLMAAVPAKALVYTGPNYSGIKTLSQKSFASDGKIIYGAQKAAGEWYIVIQGPGSGLEVGPYLDLNSIVVGPNTSKYAFNALKSDNSWYVSIGDYANAADILGYGPYKSVGNLYFSSDGRQLAYVAKKADGQDYLISLNLADNQAKVLDSGENLILFAFSGSKISYLKDGTVYSRNTVDNSIIFQSAGNGLAAVSADASFYIYSKVNNGVSTVYLQKAGDKARALVTLGRYARLEVSDNLVLSDNNSRLAYAAVKENSKYDSLFIANPAVGGPAQELASASAAPQALVHTLGFSKTGQLSVAFSFDDAKIQKVVLIKNLVMGQERFFRLTDSSLLPFSDSISPDFKKISYIKHAAGSSDYQVAVEDLDKEYIAPRCGDYNVSAGEKCDGKNLDKQTCQSLGFASGSLACTADCKSFDTSRCLSVFKNSCTDTDGDNPGVASFTYFKVSPTGLPLEYRDECLKGDKVNEWVCEDNKPVSKTYACANGCRDGKCLSLEQSCYDSDGDDPYAKGQIHGMLNSVPFSNLEFCVNDQSFNEFVCATSTSGIYSKKIYTCENGCANGACRPSVASCGNGKLESGEVCDGANLHEQSCGLLGKGSGVLSCAKDCRSFDTGKCIPTPPAQCGNGITERGEECDGNPLFSCSIKGFNSGITKCTGCQLDFSACYNVQASSTPAAAVKIVYDYAAEAKLVAKSGDSNKALLELITNAGSGKKKNIPEQKKAWASCTQLLLHDFGPLAGSSAYDLNNFVVYGTLSTAKLSSAQRCRIVRWSAENVGLPKNIADWTMILTAQGGAGQVLGFKLKAPAAIQNSLRS